MTSESLVRESFAEQAVWCVRLGSPFTARLLEGLGTDLDRSTRTGKTVLDWQGPPNALGDAVALRLAGALHALVRRGQLPALAALYPPNDLPGLDALTIAALAALDQADDDITAWLAHAPQTNEVARSVVLYPGMMQIAQKTGLPLALFELGSSGGLNLYSDQFCYQLGDASLGQDGSPVRLAPQWSGRISAAVQPVIHSRRGCDLNPLDVTDAAHRERLTGYVWPDQPDRLARVEGAITLARQDPPQLDRSDAADWVEKVIQASAPAGHTRVLFHSIAFQYFPAAAQKRITAQMETAGAAATADAPLAWLAFEQFNDDGPQLTLRLWPDGGTQVLAKADAHCRKVNWLG